MPTIYDISTPLSPETTVYRGDPRFRLRFLKRLEKGDPFALSHISMGSHTGTHVDAPSHFIKDGASVEDLSLGTLTGPAFVYHAGEGVISSEMLASAEIPPGTQRLLLATGGTKPGGVSLEAARWLVGQDIKLVGIDRLSIDSDDAKAYPVHIELLGHGIAIIEGLHLKDVPTGEYCLYCLPLKIPGAEGAPARAMLVKDPNPQALI